MVRRRSHDRDPERGRPEARRGGGRPDRPGPSSRRPTPPRAPRARAGSRSAPRAGSCRLRSSFRTSPSPGSPTRPASTVGNVDKHSLLLAPAERADVIVDFSQYRGKTLILYNDAPAAFPARQANMDYYTGGPDMTSSGGAPTTLPGYGPNTRTIMQVKVSTAAPEVAFDRPNTTADRMGALVAGVRAPPRPSHRQASRRVRVLPGPDHRRPGRLQLGLRFQLRGQRLLQQRHPSVREVRRVRPDQPSRAETCSSSTPWARHQRPRPARSCRSPCSRRASTMR